MVLGVDLKSVEYEKYVSNTLKNRDLKKAFGMKADSPEDLRPHTEFRINLYFNKKGAKDLESLTRENYRKRIALVVNGEIKYLAVVVTPILDGKITIIIGDEKHAKNVVKEIKRSHGL